MLLFIDNSMSESFKTLKSFLETQPNIITLLQSGSTSETCFFKCFKNRSIQKQSKLSILYILSVSFSGAQRAQMNQRNKSSAHNGVVGSHLTNVPKFSSFLLEEKEAAVGGAAGCHRAQPHRHYYRIEEIFW